MAKRTSTNSRTLTRARELGWTIAKTEQWIKHPGMVHGKRKDIWGFGDALAFKGQGIALFQSCAKSGLSDHWAKVVDECTVDAHGWLFAGGLIEIWAWYKKKIPGERRLWHVERWRIEVCARVPLGPHIVGEKYRSAPDGTEFYRWKVKSEDKPTKTPQ